MSHKDEIPTESVKEKKKGPRGEFGGHQPILLLHTKNIPAVHGV
jgi:hypothetical protein